MLQSKIKNIKEILSELKRIKYGSVEIVVHDGEIVQIEKKEKFRIEKQSRHTA